MRGSQRIQPGDVYAAVSGARAHGVKYAGAALESGAVGIGLFRSEFLFMNRDGELPSEDEGHVYHLYVVRSPRRDEIAAALTAAGIACASYYVTPLHLQPAMAYLGIPAGTLPETERAAAENLALPMWAGITREQQERVVEAVRSAVGVPA